MVIFPQAILDMPEGSDRDYMEWLYREYCALMFSTAWKYFRDKADVEDIVSDGCVSLMRNIPALRSLERDKIGSLHRLYDSKRRLQPLCQTKANERPYDRRGRRGDSVGG